VPNQPYSGASEPQGKAAGLGSLPLEGVKNEPSERSKGRSSGKPLASPERIRHLLSGLKRVHELGYLKNQNTGRRHNQLCSVRLSGQRTRLRS
jgi:hypothetical protein